MFENPRRGRQARNFATTVPKILDLKSSSPLLYLLTLRKLHKIPQLEPVYCGFCSRSVAVCGWFCSKVELRTRDLYSKKFSFCLSLPTRFGLWLRFSLKLLQKREIRGCHLNELHNYVIARSTSKLAENKSRNKCTIKSRSFKIGFIMRFPFLFYTTSKWISLSVCLRRICGIVCFKPHLHALKKSARHSKFLAQCFIYQCRDYREVVSAPLKFWALVSHYMWDRYVYMSKIGSAVP